MNIVQSESIPSFDPEVSAAWWIIWQKETPENIALAQELLQLVTWWRESVESICDYHDRLNTQWLVFEAFFYQYLLKHQNSIWGKDNLIKTLKAPVLLDEKEWIDFETILKKQEYHLNIASQFSYNHSKYPDKQKQTRAILRKNLGYDSSVLFFISYRLMDKLFSFKEDTLKDCFRSWKNDWFCYESPSIFLNQDQESFLNEIAQWYNHLLVYFTNFIKEFSFEDNQDEITKTFWDENKKFLFSYSPYYNNIQTTYKIWRQNVFTMTMFINEGLIKKVKQD